MSAIVFFRNVTGQKCTLDSLPDSVSPPRFVWLLCAMGLATLLAGCGGSNNSGGSGSGFSASASTAFAAQLAGAASQGMVSSASAAVSGNRVRPDQISCTQTSCVVNLPLSFTLNCTTGGNMKLTGTIDGSMNNTGTGLIGIQADITITDWSCIQGFIINGAPDITITGMFSFINGAPATTQSIDMGGAFEWGSSAADVCNINLTTNFNADGSGDTSGTLCGNPINTSFPALQVEHMNER